MGKKRARCWNGGIFLSKREVGEVDLRRCGSGDEPREDGDKE
jgi:hypothetical protein